MELASKVETVRYKRRGTLLIVLASGLLFVDQILSWSMDEGYPQRPWLLGLGFSHFEEWIVSGNSDFHSHQLDNDIVRIKCNQSCLQIKFLSTAE